MTAHTRPPRPRQRPSDAPPRLCAPRLISLVLVLVTLAASCGGSEEEDDVIRIGAGSTAEQQLLAALSAELLDRSGTPTAIVSALGDTAGVRNAGLSGRIDAFWDYSGAAWTLGLGLSAPAVDAQESFEAVASADADNGLMWLAPSGADAELAFFVPAQQRPDGTEGTLSWLAGRLGSGDGALCADRQYLEAPAGYAYLADTYAIATDSVTTVAAVEGKAIDFVATGDCLAGMATATSGAARLRGLAVLIDDQGVFPSMVAAPVIVDGGRADVPEVTGILVRLAEAIDTEVLGALNARVADGELIDEVAADYLDDTSLS